MACDEGLVERIREALADVPDIGEKRMFGGVCFTLRGNMMCGVVKDELMVRVGQDAHQSSLSRPHAREMDFTGKPMKGYVFVESQGLSEDDGLMFWIEQGRRFVDLMPAKAAKPASVKKKSVGKPR